MEGGRYPSKRSSPWESASIADTATQPRSLWAARLLAQDRRKMEETGRQRRAADWAVEPKGPWNYALLLDGKKAGLGMAIQINKMGANPFTANGTPIVLIAQARRVPDWKLADGSAGTVPESPVAASGPVEEVELIPFAAAKLRITSFPVARKK